MASLFQFPVLGWAVRAGGSAAHYFVRDGRSSSAVCGSVERIDKYVPQALRPQQADKPHCHACARGLERLSLRTRRAG